MNTLTRNRLGGSVCSQIGVFLPFLVKTKKSPKVTLDEKGNTLVIYDRFISYIDYIVIQPLH